MVNIETPFLSEQIELLDKILVNSIDLIYVYDRAGRYLYASPTSVAILGLQVNDIVGKSWRELGLWAEAMEIHDAQREVVFQTGAPIKGEVSYPTVGGIRYYEYVISPIFGKEGEVEAVTNTGRDITERKQAEEALRLLNEELEARVQARTEELAALNESLRLEVADRQKAEQRLQKQQSQIQRQLAEIETIYRSAPIGLNVLDTELRFIRINQQLADMNGLPIEAHIGHTVRELFPNVADTIEQLLRPILETGEPLLNVEITGETPAHPGVERVWLESFLPLKDGDCIIGISTVCEEITERKQIEAERQRVEVERTRLLQQEQMARIEVETLLRQLEAERSRLEQVLQQMPVGVSIAEAPSGKLVYCNEESSRLLRHPLLNSETYQHYTQYGAIHSDGHPYQPEEYPLAHALLTGKVVKAEEMRYCRGDGSLTLLAVSAAPIFDQDGQIIAAVSTFEDIADRKAAEQTLAKELLRIQALFNTSFDGIVILSEQGEVLEANPRFAEMLGYSLEETMKLSIGDWEAQFTPEQLQLLFQDFVNHRRGVIETQHRRKDSSIYDVEVSYNIVDWDEGLLRFCACRDITDRKLAETALQQSEEQLRLAFEFAQIGHWDWDLLTNQITWNPVHFRLLGLDPETAAPSYENWRACVHPDDVAQIEVAIQEALQTHTPYVAEYRVIRPDGSLGWMFGKGQAIYNASGQPIRMLGVLLDTTDRKRAEAQLRERERLFSTLAEALPVAIFRFDKESNCIYINNYWTVMTGRTAESVMGLGWVESLHPEDREHLVSTWLEWSQNAQQRGLYKNEGRLVHLNGQVIWYDIQALAEVDANGETVNYIGTLTDITSRKQAEAELQEREAILRLFAQYAPAGIAMFDREMRYVMTSQRWAEDYHLVSVESLIGRSHYEVFPEISERWKQVHQRCMAGTIEKCEEDLFVRADGTQQWIRWEIRPWHTAINQIGGIIVFSEDITQRKQAEADILKLNQELQHKVNELQILLDVIPIGIGIATDPDCQQIRVNPGFSQMLGISSKTNASLSAPEAERPTNFKVYQNGRELAPEELPLQIAAKYGVEIRELEVDVVWQNGTTVTLLEYAAPLLDEQGQPRGSVGAFLDITERKRAEADLQRYKDLFQFSENGLAISVGSRIEMVNPAFARMHGYSVEEMRDKSILDLFPSELRAETLTFIERLDRAGHLSYESYHRRKDGSVFPILLDITVVKDEEGNLLYRIVTAFDITERKRGEEALRESEERYRILVQNFPNGVVCLFDADFRYVVADGQGLAELDLDHSVMEGKTIWEVFDPETCRVLERDYQRVFTGQADITEIPYRGRIYRSHLLPLYDDRGVVKLGMSMTQDITVQKIAEEGLRASRDELEAAVRERTRELGQIAEELQRSNEELEQFAYIASHDLQEPLRAITSFTQLLAKRYSGQLDAKAETYIEFIVDGAIRMQQLVKDLLAYSRTGRHELSMRWVDCNSLLEQVKKDLQIVITENQAVITADPLPRIVADPNQMANLLQNLLGNSLKYRSTDVPQIHLSAKLVTRKGNGSAPEESAVESTGSAGEWLFSIRDNGIGIEPRYRDRIFGIFQRLHANDEYSGTGLGLAICRKIVERHAGRIWVESQLGQGATFFFTIPIVMRAQDGTSG